MALTEQQFDDAKLSKFKAMLDKGSLIGASDFHTLINSIDRSSAKIHGYLDDFFDVTFQRGISGVTEEVFSDDAFPDATVRVDKVWIDKRDPMNPNPAAGRQRGYMIFVGDRKSRVINNVAVALSRAQLLHHGLVEGLRKHEAEKYAHIPTFGMF
jgi:hypothetical protein